MARRPKPDDTADRVRPGRVGAKEAVRRRELLLDTALEEFLAYGFGGANLDRIAKSCRISKMTIYRQIGGKEELFLLATERAARALKRSCQDIIDRGGPPEEVVAAVVELCKASSKHNNFSALQLAIGECRSSPQLASQLLSGTVDIYQPIADYLRKLSGGRLSEDQARREALILMSMAIGGFLKLLGSSEPDDPAWSSDVCRIFIDGAVLRREPPVADRADGLQS